MSKPSMPTPSSLLHWADSHAHVSSLPNAPEVIERSTLAGVQLIINICTDQMTLEKGLDLASLHVLNAGATTPHDVAQEGETCFPLFAQAAREKRLVAIGETGLDYHYEHSPRSVQKQFLVRYLHLAMETKLPVIFHCREAFEDLFSIVDAEYKGVAILHCFTGTMKEAEEVLRRGWYLSLSGIVTYKKSEDLRAVAREVPLNQMLLETDTPFLAPQSRRGKPNEPAYLPEIGSCIAQQRSISIEEVAQATYANACRIFS